MRATGSSVRSREEVIVGPTLKLPRSKRRPALRLRRKGDEFDAHSEFFRNGPEPRFRLEVGDNSHHRRVSRFPLDETDPFYQAGLTRKDFWPGCLLRVGQVNHQPPRIAEFERPERGWLVGSDVEERFAILGGFRPNAGNQCGCIVRRFRGLGEGFNAFALGN